MNKKYLISLIFIGTSSFFCSCSPIKSSPQDQKHQLELTLHEVQTNLDDLRHYVQTFQAELQIIDARLKKQDDVIAQIKQKDIEQQKLKIASIDKSIKAIETSIEKGNQTQKQQQEDIRELSSHANQTTTALSQYKNRINEIEKDIVAYSKTFDDIKKSVHSAVSSIKSNKDYCGTLYKVKSGDSLERIAKNYKVSIEEIKKENSLDNDLIVIGQELKIPVK